MNSVFLVVGTDLGIIVIANILMGLRFLLLIVSYVLFTFKKDMHEESLDFSSLFILDFKLLFLLKADFKGENDYFSGGD